VRSTDQPGDGATREPGSPTRPDASGPSGPRPVRVLLVDDHRLVLESLARVLDEEPDINIVGTATTVSEAKEVAREPVDVVLMDYRLPDGTGVEATRTIKARWPGSRIIMLTAVDDDETVLESIQAGADGYLTKDKAIDDVVATVRAANAGATLLPRDVIVTIAKRVAENRDRQAERTPVEALTPRELEVLRALVEGLSTPDICSRLVITPNTLRTHVQNIMGKLHVHSKLEAVSFALRYKLVDPPRAD
jgi:DNA-binding NarL/FixJ family response regulator